MQLTPEQINEFVAKAILESQIGEAVQDAVKRSIDDLRKSYNNPFDVVVKRHVEQIIDKELLTAYRPLLEAGIKEAMRKQLTDEVMTKIIETAMEKLRRNY